MAGSENKDKIKEILEGHNKKFTAAELVVGIVVLLVIGCAIGYVVFKLLAPKQTTPNSIITKVQQPPAPTATENKEVAVNAKSKAEVTNKNKKAGENNKNIENGTETSSTVTMTSNNTQNEEVSEQTGPKIITPESENSAKNNNNLKNEKNKKTQNNSHVATTRNTTPKRATKKYKTTMVKKHSTTNNRVVYKHHKYIHQTKYIIQVSSNKNRKLALLNVIKLRKCGHNAFTKEVKIKGTRYTRVYIGPIKGYSVAKQEAKEVKKQLHLKYFPLIKKDD